MLRRRCRRDRELSCRRRLRSRTNSVWMFAALELRPGLQRLAKCGIPLRRRWGRRAPLRGVRRRVQSRGTKAPCHSGVSAGGGGFEGFTRFALEVQRERESGWTRRKGSCRARAATTRPIEKMAATMRVDAAGGRQHAPFRCDAERLQRFLERVARATGGGKTRQRFPEGSSPTGTSARNPCRHGRRIDRADQAGLG